MLYFIDGTPTCKINCIDRFICRYTYSKNDITNNMVCAQAADKSACNGDSGGPLIIKNTNIQIGIVSWLVNNCQDGRPNVFTDVSVFKSWIDTYLNAITTSTQKPWNDAQIKKKK
eukprot:551865_1